MRSKIFWILGFLIAVGIALFFLTNLKAEAKRSYDVCHCQPKKGCETLSLDLNGVNGHIKSHKNDYRGECKVDPEPVYHAECIENACVQVEGEGNNMCEVNDDCIEVEPEPEPEPTPEPKPVEKPTRPTFSEDTRCKDNTPPAVTWVAVEDGSESNNWFPYMTWSAEGGDTIELCFSETYGDPRWCTKMLNDGHEELGHMENTGILGMVDYYGIVRTVNGCKSGSWSEIKWFN